MLLLSTALLSSALLPRASAMDVDLSITVPDRPPVELTLLEVAPGRLPSVSVPGERPGQSYRVTVDLAEVDQAGVEGPAERQLRAEFLLEEVTVERRDRERVRTISRPTMTFQVSQPAAFFMGGEVPQPDGTLLEVGYSLEMQVHE